MSGAAPEPQALLEQLQGKLGPGDALGVGLITGDLALGATGTVTNVVGDRVYAFGHPFYNLGPTTFPMTRALVHVVLPSLLSSTKIASLGDVIGTIDQDRATAIAGSLGRGPSMLPIHIALETDRGPRREFTFNVVRDQLFTPLLTYLGVVDTLKLYEREFGASSFTVKGKALVAQHGEIAFEDMFTGDSPSVGAAAYVAGPLAFLLTNDYEPVEIDRLDLTIVSSESPRTAELERVWVDTTVVRPGATVPVKVLVRNYRGDEVTHTVQVAIPVNATGGLTLLVADGVAPGPVGTARGTPADAGARRSPDGEGLQQGTQEQPPLHSPARRRRRRGRRRRAAGRPAAVGPCGARRRSQQQRRRRPSAPPRSASGTSPRITPSAALAP